MASSEEQYLEVGVCDAEKSNCEWWNCRTWLTCHKKILCVIIVIISIFSVISLGVAWHISNTKCSCKVKEEAPPPTAERFSALDMDNRDKDEMRTRVNHNNTINKNLDLAEIRFGEKHKNTINATCFLCDKECYGIDELKSSRGEMRCPRYIVTIACKHVSWMASRGNYCKGGESVCLGQDVSAHMCAYRQGNRPQVYNETLTTHT